MNFSRGKVIDDWTRDDLYNAFDLLYSAGTKTGVYYTNDLFAQTIIKDTNNIEAPKLLPKRYLLLSEVLLFPQRHFLFEVFDRKIQQVLEADLLSVNLGEVLEGYDARKFKLFKEPFAVLTLSELKAGFVVSIAPLALSLMLFCIEWLVTLKDFLVFRFTFKAYFSMKKH